MIAGADYHWDEADRLFDQALELPPEQRGRWLDECCGGNPALRQQVDALLRADVAAANFLELDGWQLAEPLLEQPESIPAAGRGIGPYRVVRELARGGMGVVYLAERADGQFEQRVALKLIKRGMDSDEIHRRFLAERQILARLNHPHIARLLDGGVSAEGQPYFAIEYVEGTTITAHCEERRLGLEARLSLFLDACEAVRYAHQHLVVHRDLKPSNILVTADGEVKLLDFGIAKLLSQEGGAETGLTETGVRVMTPEYAAPEQVRGQPVTTATDVYALGTVLYELLAGRRAYRLESRTPAEVDRVVCELEPSPPSVVAQDGSRARLRGDLDSIVLTALRKEPARRYASVDLFADDVRRHLAGQPVQARPDTLRYRAGKFVRRNRVAVVAAVLVGLALVGGIVASAWQARVARTQAQLAQAAQARAERRFADVRKLAHSLLFDYHDAIKTLPGATPVRARLVRDALEYLDTLAQEARGNPSLQQELASAYRRVGDVQGGQTVANLGDTKGAIDSYRKSVAVLERLLRAAPDRSETRRELAEVATSLGVLMWETGEIEDGLQHTRRGRNILEPLVAKSPGDTGLRLSLSRAYDAVGSISRESGDLPAALESHRKQLRLLESIPDSVRKSPAVRRSLSLTHQHLGQAVLQQGDLPQALESLRRCIALRTALSSEFPDNLDDARILYVCRYWEAGILVEMGRPREALAKHRLNLPLTERLAAADPKNVQYRNGIGFTLVQIGAILTQLGELRQALPYLRRAQAMRAEDARADSTSLWKREALIDSDLNLCTTLTGLGDRGAARAACTETASLLRGTQVDSSNVTVRVYLGYAYSSLGVTYAELGSDPGAIESERSGDWRTARDLCQRSKQIWSDLSARGILPEQHASERGAATIAVQRCDSAMGAPGARAQDAGTSR